MAHQYEYYTHVFVLQNWPFWLFPFDDLVMLESDPEHHFQEQPTDNGILLPAPCYAQIAIVTREKCV